MTTEYATAALTNQKNHFLDGRKLVVEYASPEAVRRGGAGPRAKKGGEAKYTESATDKPRRERVRPKRNREDAGGEGEGDAQENGPPAKRRRTEDGSGGDGDGSSGRAYKDRKEREGTGSKTRAKPGAALANARRGTVGIVPSQGKKIVF